MVKEVDTVITAGEVLDLIKKAEEENLVDIKFENLLGYYQDLDLLNNLQPSLHLEEFLFENLTSSKLLDSKLKTNTFEKSNSHSYLETIIRSALRDHYKVDPSQVGLNYKYGKNQDVEVIFLILTYKKGMYSFD
jgi:hypothetical protein